LWEAIENGASGAAAAAGPPFTPGI
jgi:hypothetical protein